MAEKMSHEYDYTGTIDRVMSSSKSMLPIAVTMQRELRDMQKKEFERLATACQEIEAGLQNATFVEGQRGIDEVMELVVARIAVVCAADNKAFDSFRFNAVARKRKE